LNLNKISSECDKSRRGSRLKISLFFGGGGKGEGGGVQKYTKSDLQTFKRIVKSIYTWLI